MKLTSLLLPTFLATALYTSISFASRDVIPLSAVKSSVAPPQQPLGILVRRSRLLHRRTTAGTPQASEISTTDDKQWFKNILQIHAVKSMLDAAAQGLKSLVEDQEDKAVALVEYIEMKLEGKATPIEATENHETDLSARTLERRLDGNWEWLRKIEAHPIKGPILRASISVIGSVFTAAHKTHMAVQWVKYHLGLPNEYDEEDWD
ncbi:hypothetical protein HK102_012722 [Quaeritorhiza haematococci]|nr:hypothetical protein HK102_012722 [Quaeritorhiza haematococci]